MHGRDGLEGKVWEGIGLATQGGVVCKAWEGRPCWKVTQGGVVCKAWEGRPCWKVTQGGVVCKAWEGRPCWKVTQGTVVCKAWEGRCGRIGLAWKGNVWEGRPYWKVTQGTVVCKAWEGRCPILPHLPSQALHTTVPCVTFQQGLPSHTFPVLSSHWPGKGTCGREGLASMVQLYLGYSS